MKKPKNISERDRAFLDQIDALIGDPEPSPKELAAELEQVGLDSDELRDVAFQRIRSFATQEYSSKGKYLPIRLSEALKQLRPPTPEEQEASRAEQAFIAMEFLDGKPLKQMIGNHPVQVNNLLSFSC
jgi:hypothetical protein